MYATFFVLRFSRVHVCAPANFPSCACHWFTFAWVHVCSAREAIIKIRYVMRASFVRVYAAVRMRLCSASVQH